MKKKTMTKMMKTLGKILKKNEVDFENCEDIEKRLL